MKRVSQLFLIKDWRLFSRERDEGERVWLAPFPLNEMVLTSVPGVGFVPQKDLEGQSWEIK